MLVCCLLNVHAGGTSKSNTATPKVWNKLSRSPIISAKSQAPTRPSISPSQAHSPQSRGRYHGGRRPPSDDNLHSPTGIPPSALDKPSITKRCHRRKTCSHTSLLRSPTMVTLHDTGFVECRWWNDGWTVKTVVASFDGRRPP